MTRRNGDVSYFFTVSRPGEEPWEGHMGRIDEYMLQEIDVDLDALYFICGPRNMGSDVKGALVEVGFPPENVRCEQ